MKFGYIRVSTTSQNTDRQIDILKEYGVDEIFIDKISGTKKDRPELNKLQMKLRKDDIVVVTELSRLGRSMKDLISLVESFEKIGVDIVSLKEKIDTTTAYGKFFFNINCAYAQLQRDLIVQNTIEGLTSARARGRVGGRPPVKNDKIEIALKMYDSKQHSIKEITATTKISQATLYKHINLRKDQ